MPVKYLHFFYMFRSHFYQKISVSFKDFVLSRFSAGVWKIYERLRKLNKDG